jgi:LacI family transcriptional regulator
MNPMGTARSNRSNAETAIPIGQRGGEVRRVAVLIEREIGYRHSVLRGIFDYAQHAGNWICQGSNCNDEAVDMLQRVRPRPHGVIAGLYDLPLALRMARFRSIPVIDVYDWFLLPNASLHRVTVDNFAVGVVAAKHFLSRGFRQVAFFGHSTHRFSLERRRGFESVMSEHGVSVTAAPRGCSDIDAWRRAQPVPRQPLAEWVRHLPKPTAVFCASDAWGMVLT